MKEVLAIIQMNKMEATKDALDVIGIPSITAYKVSGRGKQKGLQIPHPSPLDEADEKRMKYIPKRMISVMVRGPVKSGLLVRDGDMVPSRWDDG